MAVPQKKTYTVKDIYDLPDGQRAELIDGHLYMMVPPNFQHQKLVYQLGRVLGNYVDSHGGACEIVPAPFAVFLSKDDQNYVEPDLSVICDRDKLDEKGCHGAPDWIIEIVSPSTERMDYGIKLFKYRSAGVREYWIVNPLNRTVNVYDLEYGEQTGQHRFDGSIPSCIYRNLTIRIADLLSES